MKHGTKLSVVRRGAWATAMIPGVMAIAVSLGGCGGSKPPREFNLLIVVTDKLGNRKTDKLPEEVIKLCLPLTECESANLVPKPKLYRLGSDNHDEQSLETRIDGGFAGNPKNVNLIRGRIEKHLATERVGDAFARENPVGFDAGGAVDGYIATLGKQTLPLILSPNGVEQDTYKSIRVLATIDSVRARILEEVCEGRVASAVVFLDPPLDHQPVGTIEPPRSHDGSEASDGRQPLGDDRGRRGHSGSVPSRDEVLVELGEENAKAAKIQEAAKRAQALGAIAQEIEDASDETDYRFRYELVKNRVYGKHHVEAFEYLTEAARIAIEQGQSEYLLDRMAEDKENVLWRLAHGHQQWHEIEDALRARDKNRLPAAENPSDVARRGHHH